MTLRHRLIALAGAAVGLPLSACSAPPAPVAHRGSPPPTSPLHPLLPADEATTTVAPTTTTKPVAAAVVTIEGLPAPTPSGTTTTTFAVPEAETEESDEEWWAGQEGYVPGACGGSLPPCSVMRRESGGNPNAVNATGCGGRGCFGKWQFDPRTSQGLGYPLTMDQYPESVQDDAARTLWAGGRGCSHWNAC